MTAVFIARHPGHAEIGDHRPFRFGAARRRDEDHVAALEVSVHHPDLLGGFETRRHLTDQRQRLVDGERPLPADPVV